MVGPGSDDDGAAPPRASWGLGDVFGGWVLALVAATFVTGIVLSLGPWATSVATDPGSTIGSVVGDLAVGRAPSLPDPVPLAVTALLQAPLWAVLLLVPWWAARTKGLRPVRDLGIRARWVDLPVGVAIGVASQVVLLPALYWVVFRVIGDQDVSAAARQLTDRATSPVGVVLLLLIVGVGAPIVEEVFFRGMAQQAFEKRGLSWGPAVVCTALFFAATHLQPLQFPGLFAFGLVLGWLVHRTGRLGGAIWAHVAFNVTAAAMLVWDLGA